MSWNHQLVTFCSHFIFGTQNSSWTRHTPHLLIPSPWTDHVNLCNLKPPSGAVSHAPGTRWPRPRGKGCGLGRDKWYPWQIHGTKGIFTYMNGLNLWFSCREIYNFPWILWDIWFVGWKLSKYMTWTYFPPRRRTKTLTTPSPPKKMEVFGRCFFTYHVVVVC